MDSTYPSGFEHRVDSLEELRSKLRTLGSGQAILKVLPRNANDKNQVYIASSFSALYNNFDLTLSERGASASLTKDHSTPGSYIPEARFNRFGWFLRDGRLVPARNVKVIIYPQYPEARLSGFLTVEHTMPRSLSVEFTRRFPERPRLLVLACLPGGACAGMICIDPGKALLEEVAALPGLEGSRVCRLLTISQDTAGRLFQQLSEATGRPLKGCRLDRSGQTVPFTGTQVCGYTLEHELGIIPNSGKDGDLYGIELKTHMQAKVTLFTPEPDFGLYVDDFAKFMKRYGYRSGDDVRVTGIHREGIRCKKSGLTLRVREYRPDPENPKDWQRDAAGHRIAFSYDPDTDLTAKMNGVEVVLLDDQQHVAAGWSLQRLMNNWGVKHNEVVYIPARRKKNTDPRELAEGFRYKVTLSPHVMWCRGTSAERLLAAISAGVIFLDPAPKYVEKDPGKNKRRAQWRVNNIADAVPLLYEYAEQKDLSVLAAR